MKISPERVDPFAEGWYSFFKSFSFQFKKVRLFVYIKNFELSSGELISNFFDN